MAYRDVVLADFPWAYWRGAITAGQVLDETGANRHMNVNGAVTNSTSLLSSSGSSMVFPGTTGAFLDMTTSPTIMGTGYPRSIEFWVLANEGLNDNGCVFSIGMQFGSGRCFDTNTIRRIQLTSVDSVNGESVRGEDGRLHHIWIIYDDAAPSNEAVKTYMDGMLVMSSPLAYGITSSVQRTAIGVRLATNNPTPLVGTYLNGSLQEVAFYQNAPSATTVYRHYCAGTDDGSAPVITHAAWVGSNQLLVRFNKPMFATTATANFTVSGGATVTAAVPTADLRQVLLTVTGVPANVSRTLTLSSNVKDALAVSLATPSVAFTSSARQAPQAIESPDGASNPFQSVGGVATIFVSPGDSQLDNGVRYHMRAYRTDTETYVSWAATSPDFQATQSGVNPLLLEDIVFVSMTGVLVVEED